MLAPDHLKCAIACAQKGGRLAVVTANGDDMRVDRRALTQDNNAKLIPFVNQSVVLTGTLGVIQVVAGALLPAPSPPPPGKVDKRRPSGDRRRRRLEGDSKG